MKVTATSMSYIFELPGCFLLFLCLGLSLTLVLALPMPRGLLEHKPTVPGPQEEVDKAEELQRHGRGRREVMRIGRKALWEQGGGMPA